jgi:putative addiction module component (TIGR02574 family)
MRDHPRDLPGSISFFDALSAALPRSMARGRVFDSSRGFEWGRASYIERFGDRVIIGTTSADELRAAALALPRQERADLARDLLGSLDEAAGEFDAAWASEIARRARELADGSVEPVDWEVARERIARRLPERREASAPSRG